MDDIVRHSKDLIERGSKSFAGATRLFSPSVRDDAYMLYAWCRHCDDQIDGQDLGFASAEARAGTIDDRLAELKTQTLDAIAGKADHPVFIALSRVVAKHQMDQRFPLDLLDGFAMDARGHDYASLNDTILYSYHVAGVVGVMMAIIMGVKDTATLNRACDLGIAFQLTNISRDVIDDAREGRIYLPADWLEGEGISREEIAGPEHREALYRVVDRVLTTADDYYASARHGLTALPFRSAWAIAAARRVYSEIGSVVRQRGPRAWDTRVIVPRRQKLAGAALALGDVTSAHSLGRLRTPPPRTGLWTKVGLEV